MWFHLVFRWETEFSGMGGVTSGRCAGLLEVLKVARAKDFISKGIVVVSKNSKRTHTYIHYQEQCLFPSSVNTVPWLFNPREEIISP